MSTHTLATLSLKRELQLALQLATECSTRALDLQSSGQEGLKTREKDNNQGPVTLADIEVNTLISRAIRSHFPQDAILSEESDADPDWHKSARCWIIDPIDGTRDFSEGSPYWAIHIGLCIAGEVVFGLIAEPAIQRIQWGILHGEQAGAWFLERGNARRLLPVSPQAKLVMSKSHASKRTPQTAALLGIAEQDCLAMGSVGVKVAALTRGLAQYYIHPVAGTKLWDSCAPEALLRAAGGSMTDLLGHPLRYDSSDIVNRRGLLATLGVEHKECVSTLSALATSWFRPEG